VQLVGRIMAPWIDCRPVDFGGTLITVPVAWNEAALCSRRRRQREDVMATWVAVKIAGSDGISYLNAEQIAYVLAGGESCQVNFVGAKDNYVVIEGDADKLINNMGGAARDATRE
jgi:hypothetical protein